MNGAKKWLVGATMATAVLALTGASAFADEDFSGVLSFSNPNQGAYNPGTTIGVDLNTKQIAPDTGNPAGTEFHVHGLPPYLTFSFQEMSNAGKAVGTPMYATGSLTVTNSVYNTDNVGSTASGMYTVTEPFFPSYQEGDTIQMVATLYVPANGYDGGATGTVPDMWQSTYTGGYSQYNWIQGPEPQYQPSLAQYTDFSTPSNQNLNEYDNDDQITALNSLTLVGTLPEVPLAGVLPGIMVLGGAFALVRKSRKNKK